MGKMRKEIAAGLTIIGLMLLIFGSMLYRRLRPAPDESEPYPTLTARELPMPIRNHEPRPTLVAARSVAEDEAAGGAAQAWGPPHHREAELAAANQTDLPPRESYLPRDGAALDAADAASAVDADGAEPAGDLFARPRVAVEQSERDVPVNSADLLQQQVDEELRGQSDRGTIEAAAEPAGARNPVGGRYADDQSAETIVTSGSLPPEAESPRAGFRSRFPQQEESAEEGYGTIDRQPGHLQHEPGQSSGHAQAHVTVENGKYAVQPNDNYWIISQKVYGDGGYFKAIYEHNRLRYPRADKLQVGDLLDVPHTSVLHERYAELCPKQRKVPPAHSTLVPASTRHRVGQRVYVVGEGDTLFDIARFELGKATRWAEIYELNRDVLGEEFDYLRPGTELVLPHDRRDADSMTRGGDPGLQR